MNLFDGIIRQKKKLSLKDMQNIIKDILKCLLLLKNQSLVHCDLKPENIVLVDDFTMRVKVIDFGSASFLNNQSYDLLQTKPYRAPEICFGCNFDYSADIWSLGCVLYELMTFNVLFPYKTVQENLAKALSINHVYDFKMFQEGRRRKNYINNYGLISIPPSERGSDANQVEVVIPLRGYDLFNEKNASKDTVFLMGFVNQCLVLDPSKRMKVEEALNHPFLKLKIV